VGHWSVGDSLLGEDIDRLTNAPRYSVVRLGRTPPPSMRRCNGEHWLTSAGGGSAGTSVVELRLRERLVPGERRWRRALETLRRRWGCLYLARGLLMPSQAVRRSVPSTLLPVQLRGPGAETGSPRDDGHRRRESAATPSSTGGAQSVQPSSRPASLDAAGERGAGAVASPFIMSGRLVRRLIDGPVAPGRQVVTWDGRDEGRLASGITCPPRRRSPVARRWSWRGSRKRPAALRARKPRRAERAQEIQET
jgi:hypothetical protein